MMLFLTLLNCQYLNDLCYTRLTTPIPLVTLPVAPLYCDLAISICFVFLLFKTVSSNIVYPLDEKITSFLMCSHNKEGVYFSFLKNLLITS